MFWSFFLEAQISVGVASACLGRLSWVGGFRWMILISLVTAVGLGMLDVYFEMNLAARSEENAHAHRYLWLTVFSVCVFLNLSSYTYALMKASRAPRFVRRRIMLRGVSYAVVFGIVAVPNLALFSVPPDYFWLHTTGICLYCLNAALNVGHTSSGS